MFTDVAKFDQWLRAKGTEVFDSERSWEYGVKLANDGDGTGTKILAWPDELGKPPTPEEVAAWQAPAIVDKAADVEAAMAAAKLGTAAVKATAAVEAIEKLNARVAELEKRLGL